MIILNLLWIHFLSVGIGAEYSWNGKEWVFNENKILLHTPNSTRSIMGDFVNNEQESEASGGGPDDDEGQYMQIKCSYSLLQFDSMMNRVKITGK